MTVELDDDVYEGMKEFIPYGMKRMLIAKLMKALVEAAKAEGPMVIGAIPAGEFTLILNRGGEGDVSSEIGINDEESEGSGFSKS